MSIHKKLILLVGAGLFLMLTITALSLRSVMDVFVRTTAHVSRISLEVRKIWNIENKMNDLARSVRAMTATRSAASRAAYESSRAAVHRMLNELSAFELGEREMRVLAALIEDFRAMERKVDRILALSQTDGPDSVLARNLETEIDSLLAWIGHDLERYKEENAIRLDDVGRKLHEAQLRIGLLFGVIALTLLAFLVLFGVYLHRKVSVPLGELAEGADAISHGNLDHHLNVRGERDIVLLAERFNEMSRKLKASHEDLEHRLLERTRQLAALNSVALTLGATNSLRELLQRSLAEIFTSFMNMEPRGGIFLSEPDGEHLRLAAHHGLSREFVMQEQTIKQGECLCGIAARSGEMIYTERGCTDTRHTRMHAHAGHAHIIVPIKTRGIVLGVMFLYPQKMFTLKPSDIQMFETIGAQLGMAVENLRFYAEVKESSVKYWDLFEHSRDMLITMDGAGLLTAVNDSTERFLGLSKVELTGRSIFDFLTDDGRNFARRALAGGGPRGVFELEIVKPDGSRAFVEMSGRKMRRGGVVGYQMAARDVTEQKSLRELLVRAERLAAIGQMGIAVRHEINNPLTTVIGNAELLIERLESADGDVKKRLDAILENSLRIAEIVKRLQGLKQEKTVEYVKGVSMTDLKQE